MRDQGTLQISFLKVGTQPMLPPSVPAAHPFYEDSFAALYQVEKGSLPHADQPFPTENLPFLLEVLRPVLAKAPAGFPAYFFDVRTTEEFSQTAPEYALLEGLGLQHTQPLSVKGMGSLALILGLQLASLYLESGQNALMCCAELDTIYDAPLRESLCRKACGFFLDRGSGTVQLERFGFCEDKRELQRLAERFTEEAQPDWIYTEEPAFAHGNLSAPVTVGSNGMLDPFFRLADESAHARSFRILTLLRHGKRYGYYELYKKGEEL